VTTEQAVKDILSALDSPLLGDVSGHPGATFSRIYTVVDTATRARVYDCLSTGEQALADIAFSVWRGSNDVGARVCAIGWLDKGLRAKVLGVLTALYVGEAAAVVAAGEGMEG
jgi:hypothetical protein